MWVKRPPHPSRDVIVLLCPGLRKMVHAQCRDVSTSIKSPRYTRLPSRHNLRKPWCSSSSRDFINHQGSLTVLLRTSLSPLVCVCIIHHTHTLGTGLAQGPAPIDRAVCVYHPLSIITTHWDMTNLSCPTREIVLPLRDGFSETCPLGIKVRCTCVARGPEQESIYACFWF